MLRFVGRASTALTFEESSGHDSSLPTTNSRGCRQRYHELKPPTLLPFSSARFRQCACLAGPANAKETAVTGSSVVCSACERRKDFETSEITADYMGMLGVL